MKTLNVIFILQAIIIVWIILKLLFLPSPYIILFVAVIAQSWFLFSLRNTISNGEVSNKVGENK